MNKSDLIYELLHSENSEVIVKIENGLYYPVTHVINKDGYIILLCKDITKVEK